MQAAKAAELQASSGWDVMPALVPHGAMAGGSAILCLLS